MRRHNRHSIFFAVIILIALIGITAALTLMAANTYESRLFPNTYIEGRPVHNANKTELFLMFSDVQKRVQTKQFTLMYGSVPFATFSASLINAQPDINQAFEKAYVVGRSSHFPSRILQTITAMTGLSKFEFPLTVSYSASVIDEALAHVEDVYSKKPVNATFQFENNKVVAFQKEENGLYVDVGATKKNIRDTIQQWIRDGASNKVSVVTKVLKPTVTLAQTNSFGIEELIAEGRSNYTHSIPEREHNVLLGTTKLNGVLIPKGATFSFNNTIGDISALTGYKPAYIIKEGKTVLGDGGGICQVSTTLFRAALNAGLPITEHHSHAYRVGYYENDAKPGLDATVFAPTVDLKFTNDTPASILIQTVADTETKQLFYRFYGKKDARNVQLTDPIITSVSHPGEALYQDDPTLKRGITRQVEYAALGAHSQYTYKVTKQNEVTFQKDFNIWYKPWRAVYLVGTLD